MKTSNTFFKVMLSCMLLIGVFTQIASPVYADSQSDITTIKMRLKEHFLQADTIDDGSKVEACLVSKASEYLALIEVDGSFSDVDYKATNNAANGAAWSPYLAIDRLQAIAIAYHKEGNALYQNPTAIEGLNKALLYWQSQNPRSTNWWENQVGVQLRFSRIGLFMDGVEGFSTEARDVILTKLLEKVPVKYGTGQNNLWFDQNYVYHALLTNDSIKLKEMITNYLNYCLVTQKDDTTQEAVQVDNSFYMHGKQFYSNGYGMSMFRDMSFWIYMLRNTEFAMSQEVVDRMANYMLEGTRWTIRGDIQELYLGYRPYKVDVGYTNYAMEYIEPLKRMAEVDTKHAQDYLSIVDNILGNKKANGKNGNYYMWRSGYASHMSDGYGVNIKMDSKNLKGGEWRGPWNQAGKPNQQLIYWTSSASSTIVVDGDEYTSVYPVFDWTHTPGATAPNYLSGKFDFENNELFNIGVSDGKYGATAYKFDKTNTKGQKGYFFFDEEFVALGTNISSTTGSPIHTTLNQSKADNIKINGQPISSLQATKYNAKTIYNDDIGYVFLDNTDVYVSNDSQKQVPSLWPETMKESAPSVFTAYLDHGVKPTNASYAYIVTPNKTEAEVNTYANNIPVTVVANKANVQAVRHDALKQTQINFYEAGSLEYKPGYTVTVDQPCSIMIDESGIERKITVAINDHEANKAVNVQLNYNQTQTTTHFVSKDIPYAGQSITLIEQQDDRYLASSSMTNHLPRNVFDKKIETYWQSQGNTNEWVSIFTGDNKYTKSIDIIWGDQYAKEYDVYISQNGVDYEKVASITNGDGKTDTIQIGQLCNYIKIIMTTGNASSYQIKEIAINESALLSLNKPTQTSSVSLQAPSFIGDFAVDGNRSTRWASLRNSNEEWITIDLQSIAKIDALEIEWENACSDAYSIQVSNDNKNWQTVKNLKTNTSLVDTIVLDKAISGRYVKIHSTASRLVGGKNYGINIFEIKIYGQVNEDLENINIALHKPSKASSEYTNPKSKFILESKYAFDGSLENRGDIFQSRWVSKRRKDNAGINVDSQYIQVDLEDSYEISKVALNWEDACGKEYKIQVSNDQQNWLDITHITNGKAGKIEFTYDQSITGRYVRMLGIEPSGQYGYSLWEFEVYGTKLKTQLKTLYEEKKSLDTSVYTPNSVALFIGALDKAMEVYLDQQASTTKIVEAMKLINDTFDGLVKKADTSKLQEIMEQVKQLNEKDYTTDSYQKVVDVFKEAQKIIEDANVTDSEVIEIYNRLKSSLESLVKRPIVDDNLEQPKIEDTIISGPKQTIIISGKLPSGVQLLTKSYTQTQIEELEQRITQQNKQFFKEASLKRVFDIELLLQDKKYNFDGTITVTLKVDDALKDKSIGIVYIDEQGNIISVPSIKNTEYISFKTTHLSTYAIVLYNDKNHQGVAKQGYIEVPKTVDSTNSMHYAILLACSIIVYGIFKKKYSTNQN